MVRARQAAFGEACRPLPYPLCARLLPRLACALNMPLFVHFVQTVQAPPVLESRSKNAVSKIVQICAYFCINSPAGDEFLLHRLLRLFFQLFFTVG